MTPDVTRPGNATAFATTRKNARKTKNASTTRNADGLPPRKK
jgi:hypothetical protein